MCSLRLPCTADGMFALFRRAIQKSMRGDKKKKEKPTHSKATVTQLVLNIFNSMFQDQIDADKENKERKRRCGICEVKGKTA